jgi:hypothetical protein
MRALKALVIGMAVLIFAGTILVIATILGRLGGNGSEAGFATQGLGLADSCRLAETTAVDGRLALRFEGPAPDGCRVLVLVDPDSGAVHGRIDPHAAPGSDTRAQTQPQETSEP